MNNVNRTRTACKPHRACFGHVAAVIIAVGAITPASVLACGFCTTPRGALTAIHPKSLDVAVAIRRDIDSGLLRRRVGMPQTKADRHFHDLQTGRMLAERLFLRDGFELLLIEDGSHYRIENARVVGDRNRMAAPPVRWVTGRAVLKALLGRQLEFEPRSRRRGRGPAATERRGKGRADIDGRGRGLAATEKQDPSEPQEAHHHHDNYGDDEEPLVYATATAFH